jgi:mRNA interferase MazF
MYNKDFDAWNIVKKRIQEEERKVYIRAGEVRWAVIGVNVGSEIDGKGTSFTRPVLVLHVIGSYLALVVPLSTKKKETTGYISFEWKGNTNSLCVHQIRIISQKRILARRGRVSEKRLIKIKKKIKDFFSL